MRRPSSLPSVPISALAVLALAAGAFAETPLATGFTYQGHLAIGGSPVSGACDMMFTLYDGLTAGNLVGSGPISFLSPPVDVAEGEFTAVLDWGPEVFNGNRRWLEIAVRYPARTGEWQTLSPRQELTASPYALQTRGLFVDSQNRLGLGTTAPAWPVDLVAAQGVIRLTTTTSLFGSVLELKNQAASPTYLGAINFNDAAATYPGQISFTPGTTPSLNFRVSGQAPAKVTATGLELSGNGSSRTNASLRSYNSNLTNGMAGYFVNDSGFATAHFENNGGSGEVLWLEHHGSGHYLVATSGSDWKFWVDNQGVTHTKVLEILGGADLSENFAVEGGDAAPEPGMTVSIDAEHEGRLVVSRLPYDKRVAGIVSGAGGIRTGMLMSQPGTVAAGEHPVALSGRVYCWVDASYGAVEPGDLLTTSPTAGHAMKAQDSARAQGAVLGKAMGSLSAGRGLVLTLVGLQ